MREVVPYNPKYSFCSELSEPVYVEISERPLTDNEIETKRDTITDDQLGHYRQCWTRPSDTPGCGARIQIDDETTMTAECPAGSAQPYSECAKRVLSVLLEK